MANKKKNDMNKNLFIGLVAVLIIVLAIQYLPTGSSVGKVAVVNGEVITQEEIDRRYELLSPQLQSVTSKDQILNGTINEVLLLQEAKNVGIEVNQEELDEYTATLIASAGITQEVYEQQLAERGISLEESFDLKIFNKPICNTPFYTTKVCPLLLKLCALF